ncbi:hypothetical protein [Wielerella bovis]|nr:hypothetical protein [Wielerella bovis]
MGKQKGSLKTWFAMIFQAALHVEITSVVYSIERQYCHEYP